MYSQTWDQRGRPEARHPHPLLFLGSQQKLTFLTEAAPVAREAKAGEGVDLVDAGASILTGTGGAVVNVWRGKEGLSQRPASPQATLGSQAPQETRLKMGSGPCQPSWT